MPEKYVPNAPIVVRLVKECGYFRRSCSTCLGVTDKDGTYAMWTYDDGEQHVVCGDCLEGGAARICNSLIDKAVAFEEAAADLRELATHDWILPTHREWFDAVMGAE